MLLMKRMLRIKLSLDVRLDGVARPGDRICRPSTEPAQASRAIPAIPKRAVAASEASGGNPIHPSSPIVIDARTGVRLGAPRCMTHSYASASDVLTRNAASAGQAQDTTDTTTTTPSQRSAAGVSGR